MSTLSEGDGMHLFKFKKLSLKNFKKDSDGWWLSPKKIPARVVLGMLSFGGFLTNYMLRVNLNIAIVSMTGAPNASASWNNASLAECQLNVSHLTPEEATVRVSLYILQQISDTLSNIAQTVLLHTCYLVILQFYSRNYLKVVQLKFEN
jgi:hypothetical protein